jgi:uncharacterized protein YyaL (SSP411 family)
VDLKNSGANFQYTKTVSHLSSASPKYTNRLIQENSPYLLQHAHNPVDWYPWGEEAFAKARREDKPIFLSSGYASCHWCHVMEEQCFEDEEIASLLNRYFVPIKLDREQRPDVDAVYLHAVQLLTGQGGWPLSAFLTPEGKLFFGGTYFPPAQFKALLLGIGEAWKLKRREIEEQACRLSEAVASQASEGKSELEPALVSQAIAEILAQYDPRHGGFGHAPKFPNEPWLALLLDELWRSFDPAVLEVVRNTLTGMACGGLCDQVGGGFHRYSVDCAFKVPHFEKMLYNQAQLGRLYTLAFALTGEPFLKRTAVRTFSYVLSEMTAPEGGFYSATDADSEGQEGKFFVWTPEEIRAVLPQEDAAWAREIFGITEAGNFEGKNVLHLAKAQGLSEEAFLARLDRICLRLYQARAKRIPPLRDTKILTAWNGMMIASLAEAARLLHEPRYLWAARRAAEFLVKHHLRNGSLLRASLDGRPAGEGLQEDYAFFAEGLLALYDFTADSVWLTRARELTEVMLAEFWDETNGGFFMNRASDEPLMVRPKDLYDGACPSGNAVAARVLARLYRRTLASEYRTYLEELVAGLAAAIRRSPAGFASLLVGWREFQAGEAGPVQWAADGKVRLSALRAGEAGVVWAKIAKDWSLSCEAIRLKEPAGGWRLQKIGLPHAEPLLGHPNQVAVRFWVAEQGQGSLPLALSVSICDQQSCLAQEIELKVPAFS